MEQNIIGLDIGGTKILAIRYSKDLEVLEEFRILTESEKGQDQVLKNIIQAITMLRNSDTKAVGIGWAGFVDSQTGIVHKAPNIKGFEDFPLQTFLEQELKLPVRIDNDANTFALAEQKNSSTDVNNFLGIIIGTGVGGGFIFNGQIVNGCTNFAGEIGHMLIGFESPEEAESIFSGPGLSRLFEEKMNIISMREIEKLISTRRPEIETIMNPVLEKMAFWLYNLLLSYNPGKIIFGGGIGKNVLPHFEKTLVQKIQKYVDMYQYPVPFNIGFSKLKNAEVLGSALIVRDILD